MRVFGLKKNWKIPVSEPKLHLDADASRISLMRALLERGHDVSRTPNDWMAMDASAVKSSLRPTHPKPSQSTPRKSMYNSAHVIY
jgi:hypothetical protein